MNIVFLTSQRFPILAQETRSFPGNGSSSPSCVSGTSQSQPDSRTKAATVRGTWRRILVSSAFWEASLRFGQLGDCVCLGESPKQAAQSSDRGPHAPNLGQGNPYFLNLNQTKPASVANLNSQTGWRQPVHIFVILKGIYFKRKIAGLGNLCGWRSSGPGR